MKRNFNLESALGRLRVIVLLLGSFATFGASAQEPSNLGPDPEPEPEPATEIQTDDQPADDDDDGNVLLPEAVPGEVEAFPRIFVHREQGHVDVLAHVLETRGMEYLELVACVAGTREHEALVAARIRPSHLHAALLTLDLEPGQPHRYQRIDDQYVAEPATGPVVTVTVVVPSAAGPDREVPIHEWIAHQLSHDAIDAFRQQEDLAAAAGLPAPPYPEGERIDPLTFLFTGSVFHEVDGAAFYAADSSGTLVSLMNFGDDVVAARSDHTHRDGSELFNARRSAMAEAGTWVRLRLRRELPPMVPPESDEDPDIGSDGP